MAVARLVMKHTKHTLLVGSQVPPEHPSSDEVCWTRGSLRLYFEAHEDTKRTVGASSAYSGCDRRGRRRPTSPWASADCRGLS